MAQNKLFDDIDDWDKIDLDNAKFILEEARTYVSFVIDVGDKITDKAFKILALLFPIESALIAFVINEKMKGCIQDYTIANLLIFVVTSIVVIMFYLGKIVLPRSFMPKGRAPVEICKNKELLGIPSDGSTDVAALKLALVLNEIENSQAKIYFNNNQNTVRITALKLSMMALGGIVVIAVLTLWVHFFF